MKTFVITLLIFLSQLVCAQCNFSYNCDTARDAVMVTNDYCYVYKTPQTIPNVIADTTLTKLPRYAMVVTSGFKDNYFKVNINGEDGYLFCMNVSVPKRIRKIQRQLQGLPEIEQPKIQVEEIQSCGLSEDEIFKIYLSLTFNHVLRIYKL